MTPQDRAILIQKIREAEAARAASLRPTVPAKEEREGNGQRGIQTAAQMDNPEMTTGDMADIAPFALTGAGAVAGKLGAVAGSLAGGAIRRKAHDQKVMDPGPMALDAGAALLPFAASWAGGKIGGRMAQSPNAYRAALGNKLEAFLGGVTAPEQARERFPMDKVRASPMPEAPPPPPRPRAPNGPQRPPGPTDVEPRAVPQLGPRVLTPPPPASEPGPGALLGERVFEPEPPMQPFIDRGPRSRYGGRFSARPDPGPKTPGSIDEVGDTSFYGGPQQGPQAMVQHQPGTMQNTPVPLPGGPGPVPLPGPRPQGPAGGQTVNSTATAANPRSLPPPQPPQDYIGNGPLDQIVAAGPGGANSATLNAAHTERSISQFAQSQSQAGKLPASEAALYNNSAQQLGAMAPPLESSGGHTRVGVPIPGTRAHIYADAESAGATGAGFVTTKGSAARYMAAAAEAARRGRMQLVPELQSWINSVPGMNRSLRPLVSGLLAEEAP